MEWHRNPPWMASQRTRQSDKPEQQARGHARATRQSDKPEQQARGHARATSQKNKSEQQAKKNNPETTA